MRESNPTTYYTVAGCLATALTMQSTSYIYFSVVWYIYTYNTMMTDAILLYAYLDKYYNIFVILKQQSVYIASVDTRVAAPGALVMSSTSYT